MGPCDSVMLGQVPPRPQPGRCPGGATTPGSALEAAREEPEQAFGPSPGRVCVKRALERALSRRLGRRLGRWPQPAGQPENLELAGPGAWAAWPAARCQHCRVGSTSSSSMECSRLAHPNTSRFLVRFRSQTPVGSWSTTQLRPAVCQS